MTRKSGAHKSENEEWEFTVWAPFAKKVRVEFQQQDLPVQQMKHDDFGYCTARVKASAGTKYRFVLDDDLVRPDPASCYQPEGVHGWSQVVDHDEFGWSDSHWKGIRLQDMILYELHVGTFTTEGTFEAVIPKIDYLIDLGINTIEIMPVSQFPGNRNWGYDGVYPSAAQASYGGPQSLMKLVDACHQKGMAVVLDVVYNHMGPEGNYLNDFGPYFTDKYGTPWGSAINFDDAHSDHVRRFFIDSALMWLKEYHFDGLRLDAVHAIFDNSATHFLKQMRQETDLLEEETGRSYHLIAESDLNDVRLLNPYDRGGYNLDAQWADDFHHAIHSLVTGETLGYYSDFGKVEDLAKSLRQVFIYDGKYSQYRKKSIGSDPRSQPASKFVVCIQNHDQVGNRMRGDRLDQLVSFEQKKLAAGIMLMSPYIPLLFMGEEYGESSPFQYFVSHGDPDLVEAVRQGRSDEFKSFKWQGDVPDPQSEETFNRSKLNWDFSEDPQKQTMLNYYKHLITLRKNGAFSAFAGRVKTTAKEDIKFLIIEGEDEAAGVKLCALINFAEKEQKYALPEQGEWEKIFASSDEEWNGPGHATGQAGATVAVPATALLIYRSK